MLTCFKYSKVSYVKYYNIMRIPKHYLQLKETEWNITPAWIQTVTKPFANKDLSPFALNQSIITIKYLFLKIKKIKK